MMKLAYRVYISALVLLMFALAASAQVVPKNARSEKDDRNIAPTVGTGGTMGGPTGLFTVYDGQTLRKGEFTFSAAYSNYDRDPGNVDISELPVSFQIGFTDHVEFFFNTDAWRGIKVNSPRNLSGFYLPNSQLFIAGANRTGPAVILAPSGPGAGPLENRAIFRPTGSQPFVQFPYVGSAGNFGLGYSGPAFGFPANTNATLGLPANGTGNGADLFPGVGSVYGGILPGVVLQTVCSNGTTGTPGTAGACPLIAEAPSVFTLAPSYLPDAPFINRNWGESSFNTFTFGTKIRFTSLDSPIGAGIVAYYRYYNDNALDAGGFNMMQRGAGPGGNGNLIKGDVGLTFFADARLARWVNLSANVGYHYNADVKGEIQGAEYTFLDRGDEFLTSVGLDFPINKYFQPIAEFRSLQYVGGRTPNAFENNPVDGLLGARVFATRWLGFGAAFRIHINQQDRESFDENDRVTTSVLLPCTNTTQSCTPFTRTTSFTGMPPGFQASNDPNGYIFQVFAGRRNSRQGDIINVPANVTALTLSDNAIKLPCAAGMIPRDGEKCDDATTINVTTTATDQENDVLTYNYTVSGGRIVGTGANVQWDLSGAQAGTYTITAAVDDGCGLCGQTKTQTVTISPCDCVQKCVCATLDVIGPSGITSPGETMTFTANVSGGSQENVTYNWTVSAGSIQSGQGTPSIVVATTREMANSSLKATVEIGGTGFCAECPRIDDATADIAPNPSAELVDEFGKLSNDDIRSRLDAFFIVMQNNPNNQGYIINYGTDKEIAAREKLITNHITFRNFDRTRITLVRGGDVGTGINTKLYRVPPGADNPTP